jgi:hypothetical protein
MNCCDEYGDCRQGRDCPVRKRRVRAGGPPPPDMPIDMVEDEYPVQRLNAIDYIIIVYVLPMLGWLVWEALT